MPITEQRKTRGIHRRGTRALQPAATDVLNGTLYFVTDEFIIERSNGTAWENNSIGPGGDLTVKSLNISDTAPTLTMTDTTASAKSLKIVTDADKTNLYESAGAAGDIITLDLTNKRVGIGTIAPTAALHLKAGAAAASSAPLKLTSGTSLAVREDGAIEYDTGHLYFTIGTNRHQIDRQPAAASTLTGDQLATGVIYSLLTTVGILTDLTINGPTVTLSQDTNFVLSGGVNGLSFDGTTLSIDATNNRIGIGTAAPAVTLDVQDVTGQFRVKSTTGANPVICRFDNTGGAAQFGLNGSTASYMMTGGLAYAMFMLSAGTNPIQLGVNDIAVMSLVNGGRVGIGINAPATSALLDLTSTVGALLIPRMTTTQRDALTAVNGMLIYNATDNKFQGRENGAWVNLI